MTPRSFLTHVCALAASAMFVAPALAQNALDEIVAKKSITIAIRFDRRMARYGSSTKKKGIATGSVATTASINTAIAPKTPSRVTLIRWGGTFLKRW